MANEWNTHLDSLKDRLSQLNDTIDVIKHKVEKRPGLDAATQSIAGLISSTHDKSLSQFPVVLSGVLSDSAIGAIMLNAEGKFQMFNFTAQRILGIAYVSRMSGAGDMERQEEPASFLKSDDSYFEERELPWKRVMDGVPVNNFRLKVKKDAISDVRWINVSAIPFAGGGESSLAVSGGIVFLFDFTDEVNLETSINTLCGVIAGQISQVGNSQRELEQLANQLAQTGIQKILLDKGITGATSPQARAPEELDIGIGISPVPDLSQRARFQPEVSREREVIEERKKSEETPEELIDKLAMASEPEVVKAQESQSTEVKDNNGSAVHSKDIEEDDIAPWPEEADAEDFNKPLWEEYGKGEEESAQSWTKNLDAVVSEVIEESRDSQSSFSDDDDEDDENEIDEIELEEVHSEEEQQEIHVELEHEEEHEHHEEVHVEEIIEEVVEEIPHAEVTLQEEQEVQEEQEENETPDFAPESEAEIETEAESEFETEVEPEISTSHDETDHQLDTGSFGQFGQIEAQATQEQSEPVQAVESSEGQVSNEFDEFEPIDQMLSFEEEEKQAPPFKEESQFPELPLPIVQNLVDEAFEPITQEQDFQAPPPFLPPDMPAAIAPAANIEEPQVQEPEDFSNVQSLVQKPSLKDTLLGGGKKKRTSASMHKIRAMGGATELGGEVQDAEAEQTVEYSQDDSEADLNIKKVLVVDDIPVNQKLLLLHLRRLGYDADVASNGQEALDALANKEYELILMDCDMPVMNGFEAAARIRSNESYSHRRIPIIALTSYDREGDRERCIAAGMDDYITKGASRKELKEAIKRSVVSAREKGHAQSGEFNLDDIQADIAPLDIKAMLKLYGKEEVEEISRLFLSNMGTYIECMQLAIDEKDADSVVHFANAVKGPCAALGMKLMTRLTTDIISYSEAKDWTQVRVKYMRLKAVFVQTREELKKVCPDDSLLAK